MKAKFQMKWFILLHSWILNRHLPTNVFAQNVSRTFLLQLLLIKNRLLGYIITLIVCLLYNTRPILYMFLFIVLITFAPHIFPFIGTSVVLSFYATIYNTRQKSWDTLQILIRLRTFIPPSPQHNVGFWEKYKR